MKTLINGYKTNDGDLPLYRRYPTQTDPQPAYVEIHPDGRVVYDWNTELGSGVPESVWHDRVVRISGISPFLSQDGVRQLDEEIRPLLERIRAGHNVVWNGNNHVGTLTEDGAAARFELSCEIESTDWECYDLAQPAEME